MTDQEEYKKCSNFLLCKNKVHEHEIWDGDKPLCDKCSHDFGFNLIFVGKTHEECQICLEIKDTQVQFPGCNSRKLFILVVHNV